MLARIRWKALRYFVLYDFSGFSDKTDWAIFLMRLKKMYITLFGTGCWLLLSVFFALSKMQTFMLLFEWNYICISQSELALWWYYICHFLRCLCYSEMYAAIFSCLLLYPLQEATCCRCQLLFLVWLCVYARLGNLGSHLPWVLTKFWA